VVVHLKPVASGLPQGNLIGHVLFSIVISDLKEVSECMLIKFVGGTTWVGDSWDILRGGTTIQRDLDRLRNGPAGTL